MPTIIPIHHGHSCSTPEQDANAYKLLIGGLLMFTLIVLICYFIAYLKYKKSDYRSFSTYISCEFEFLEASSFILGVIYFCIFIFVGGYYLVNLFY